MKRFVVSLTIIVILFNFIFASDVYAAGAESGKAGDSKISQEFSSENTPASNSIATDIMEEGKTNDGTGNKRTNDSSSYGDSILGVVVALLAGAVNLLVFQVDLIMGQLTYCTENSGSGNDFQYFFSIDRTVFNRIPLFNINYFNTESTYMVGDVEISASNGINSIKEKVAEIFYVVRLITTAIALLILIYIGIRMALSTLADDKAKYKQMIISWVESIVVLFLLEYIISAIILLGESLINVFFGLEQKLIESMPAGDKPFEPLVREQLITLLFTGSGLQYAMNSLMYWCLLFMQIKYFWLYMKRVLMVGFLIMIAPIITVTYAIDKIGDGKAQAFSIWMKEFTVNVLIQPLHALIYLIFVLSAGEIAKTSPIVALAFLLCMGAVERMIKVIFDLRGLVTLRGVNKLGKKE